MIRPVIDNSQVNIEVGNYIELMLEAMFTRKKIKFQYTEITNTMEKVLRREGKIYLLNLYTIYWSSNNYYLIGAHDNHQGLTHYRLDRIVNLKILDQGIVEAQEKIGKNPEAYIQNYIEESVNHFSGEIIHIEVEYIPNTITNAILYDFVGKDVKVRALEDGTYRATFTKMNSVALTAWFLQYANRFKVLKPQDLLSNIQKELVSAVERYHS